MNYEQRTTNLVSQDTISSDESRATCDGYALYICREPSTNQPIFLQNKANFPDDQMNVSGTITKDYENKSNWKLGKNKANTNPIKPNFRKAKMKLNFYSTKDYENQGPLRPPGIQTQSKPIFVPLALFIVYNSRTVQEEPIHKIGACRP